MSRYEQIPCPFKHFVEECSYENVIPGFNVACPFYVIERGVCSYLEHYNLKDKPSQPAQKPIEPPAQLTTYAKPIEPFPELKPGSYLVSITGKVVTAPEIREVETRRGPTTIANFDFTDGTITIRVAMWEDFAKQVEGFNVGAVVTLEGMSVKDPYEGKAQISSTRKTVVKS